MGINRGWPRRRFIMGGFGALAFAPALRPAAAIVRTLSSPACVLTAEQDEGPYYLQRRLIRKQIAEGLPGVPLRLDLIVLDVRSCRPLRNAIVDIWHCDALGRYSGYAYTRLSAPLSAWLLRHPGGYPEPGHPINRKTYLRGVQPTNADGCAEFSTIYPGCYAGRATHIHLKVRVAAPKPGADRVVHTGQIFFPEEVTDAVQAMVPYAANTVTRTARSKDEIFRSQSGDRSVARVTGQASSLTGYVAGLELGVDVEKRILR
ncbi:MAG: intradiol ring-cleavage dioxygenase [Pseudomonadota bacterium]|nr:intradiol ring-cleavage dioxygenase [Pseudomonadota bacterium]